MSHRWLSSGRCYYYDSQSGQVFCPTIASIQFPIGCVIKKRFILQSTFCVGTYLLEWANQYFDKLGIAAIYRLISYICRHWNKKAAWTHTTYQTLYVASCQFSCDFFLSAFTSFNCPPKLSRLRVTLCHFDFKSNKIFWTVVKCFADLWFFCYFEERNSIIV